MDIRKSKIMGLLVYAAVYLLAAFLGIAAAVYIPGSLYVKALIGTVLSALLVYLAGVLFGCTFLGPFWYAVPLFTAAGLAASSQISSPASWFIFASVFIWGVFGIGSFVYGFKNITESSHIYVSDALPRPVSDLLLLTLLPTFIIYLCCLPLVASFASPASAPFAAIAGFIISAGGIALRVTAKVQLEIFKRNSEEKIVETGIRKFIRMPDYLGEIIMWAGVFFMGLAVSVSLIFMFCGTAVLAAVICFLVIPLSEKKLSSTPGYAEYCKRTGALLPKFKTVFKDGKKI